MQAELLEHAGSMAFKAGRMDEAADRSERACSLFESHGRTHSAARVSAQLGWIRWFEGQVDTGIAEMEKSYAVLALDEPDEDLASLAAELARSHFFSGHLDEAARWVEAALEIAESLILPEVLSQALNTKGLIHRARGRNEEGIALLQHALQLALDLDLPEAASRAYFNLAHDYAVVDRHAEALALDRKGLALARKRGLSRDELLFLQHVAADLRELGEWDDALAALREMSTLDPESRLTQISLAWWPKPQLDVERGKEVTLAEVDEDEDRQTRAGIDVGRATILLAHGQFGEALEAAESAWDARDVLGMHAFTKYGFQLTGEAALALGDTARVERLVSDLAALPPGRTVPSLRAQGARFEARLAGLRGEDDRVEPSFAAATSAFQELGVPFAAAVSQLEHAEWLIGQGRAAKAGDLLAAARTTFERLGARPWLERVDRLEPRPVEAVVGG